VQVVHAEHEAALLVVLNVDPAEQAVQARFEVAEQAVDARVPAGQVVHVVQGAVPDVVVLYLPAAHVKHVDPEQYLPIGQEAQASCRAPENPTISVACIWVSLPNTVVAVAVAVNRSPANMIRKRLAI
jgi:hypothetical protein